MSGEIEGLPGPGSVGHLACFGTLVFPVLSSSENEQAHVSTSMTNRPANDSYIQNRSHFPPRYSQLLELFEREEMQVEIDLGQSTLGSSSSKHQISARVTLYGSLDLGHGLMELLQSHELYLQDPVGALKDATYWNPQRFCNNPTARTSDWWMQPKTLEIIEESIRPMDILSGFTTERHLAETEGSRFLLTLLKPHQKQALTFLINRELGWAFHDSQGDVWSIQRDSVGQIKYVNNINKLSHHISPPDFRGGIVSDTMGSGKTLSMIALVAHDISKMPMDRKHMGSIKRRQTLIIMPTSVLSSWQRELSKHLSSNEFSWIAYHGSSKIFDLKNFDIVLTTYSTLAADWRARRKTSSILSHNWYRVILDEAHYIRNPSTDRAQAVYSISATCRWVVTATPIQNRLSDLQSLLRFLRAYPYSEKEEFDDQFSHRWKSGEDEEAVDRLKRLLGFLMLRRSNAQIELPRRQDLRHLLHFDDREDNIYQAAKNKALQCLDDMIGSTKREAKYVNALQKINSLRLICNLGTETMRDTSQPTSSRALSTSGEWNAKAGYRAIEQLKILGLDLVCAGCQGIIDYAAEAKEIKLTRCLRLWCSDCHISGRSGPDGSGSELCHCVLDCPSVTLSLNRLIADETPPFPLPHCSTKIRALVHDLKLQAQGTKSIIFSFWKSTLDAAEAHLNQMGIGCIHVNGKIPINKRSDMFREFSTRKEYQVLLITLSCGAVGLNLTAASRVYLMEPQWSPSIEEQALSRIHRIGQTKNVTTIRFVMANSIEQYILELQKDKKDLLAALQVAGGSEPQKIPLGRLRELRNLLK
ncbi:hypothetical protein F5Y12DRAFT_790125 [Xylaria sp. FL1777]|nr:hypothetical protein F5Y12DRAFT_790125 [Xylaria sp. FL1777]